IKAAGQFISMPATRVQIEGESASSWLPSKVTPRSRRRCTSLFRKSAPVTYMPGLKVTIPPPSFAQASIACLIALVEFFCPSPTHALAFTEKMRELFGSRLAPTSLIQEGRPLPSLINRACAETESLNPRAHEAQASQINDNAQSRFFAKTSFLANSFTWKRLR